jgi:hypothetical protein
METLDVIFILIAVVPLSITFGAWAQKVIIYLEDLRREASYPKKSKNEE